MNDMEIPGINPVAKDQRFGRHCSEPIPIPVLGDKECTLLIEDYEEDDQKEGFHVAIKNFLSADTGVLDAVTEDVYRYYQDVRNDSDPDDSSFPSIDSPSDVWKHVHFGTEPTVSRRLYGDKEIYISLECECDWEPEHGLQIVFKNGLRVNKIGQFDGHLTNSDALDDDTLEDVIYPRA